MSKTDEIFLFDKNLIFIDEIYKDQDDLFDTIGSRLHELGYAKETLTDALRAREIKYPTGLQTESIPIAVPHADEEHVEKEGIAIIRPRIPVSFGEMACENSKIDALLIFLLLLKKGDKHVECLEMLLTMTQDTCMIKRLMEADGPEEVYGIIENQYLKQNT